MALNLGDVKPHVRAAAEEISERFAMYNIGGYRRIGSVPNSDHPKGLAIDVMTLNKTKGDAIVAWAISNAQRLGITYIIYWHRIWQNGSWSNYTGPSPHTDHVHISFSASGSGGGIAVDPVGLGLGSLPIIGELDDLADILTDPERWKRAGLMAVGVATIIIGVLLLFRPAIQETATDVIGVIK